MTSNKPMLMAQCVGGSSSTATVGFNVLPALFRDPTAQVEGMAVDNIYAVDQIGAATLAVVARAGAGVLVNGAPIGVSPQAVVGTSEWVTYRRFGVTGNVKVVSTDTIGVALFNLDAQQGAGAYFSGFPPPVNDAAACADTVDCPGIDDVCAPETCLGGSCVAAPVSCDVPVFFGVVDGPGGLGSVRCWQTLPGTKPECEMSAGALVIGPPMCGP